VKYLFETVTVNIKSQNRAALTEKKMGWTFW